MTHHTVDWQNKGKLAFIQWCRGEFLTPGIHLLPGQSSLCPSCKGMLYHDGEFRTVVCTRAQHEKPETVKVMFKRILAEED